MTDLHGRVQAKLLKKDISQMKVFEVAAEKLNQNHEYRKKLAQTMLNNVKVKPEKKAKAKAAAKGKAKN
eukprot:496056-Alexandrium_andersonii.AAC.1